MPGWAKATAAYLAALALAPVAASNPLVPPSEVVVAEAKSLVARMQAAPRGPYSQIRWFCADGSVLPPEPFACKEHGGGHQYAQYSRDRRRLAELGWHVGTIVTALTLDELWQPATRHLRMQEIPIERFLIDTQDGWVLQQAGDYRGRSQIEDEEYQGRRLLLALLADGAWTARNFLLARELAAALPHGNQADLNRAVRRQAQDLAERTPAFENVRIEVHTRPSAATIERIRAWRDEYATASAPDPEVLALADRLAGDLERLFGVAGRAERLAAHRQALAKESHLAFAAELLEPRAGAEPLERLQRLCLAASLLRSTIQENMSARFRLAALDAGRDIEAEIRFVAEEFLGSQLLSRRQLVVAANHLAAAAYGAGLLSEGERRALARSANTGPGAEMTRAQYLGSVRALDLAASWAQGTVRHAFADAWVRYAALEGATSRFGDDLLRGSALESLGHILVSLGADAQQLSGVNVQLFGDPARGLRALNPGYAKGRLRVVTSDARLTATSVTRDEIVLLPETVADLPPVAGVLTLGEGNPVSHVQLLARNFGIPNVRIDPAAADRLQAWDGITIVLVAGTDGAVFIGPADDASETTIPDPEKLTAPLPDLSVRSPLPITDLHKGLSGRIVGPKAANLGELNRLFPGRVAPAVALPFGVFADHVGREATAPLKALDRAYQDYDAGRIDAAQLDRSIARIRQDIMATPLQPRLEAALVPMMESLFGAPGTYGVFVRSDTNVEDLPGFTGAGLNETLPHLVGLEAQLAGIPRVWGSMLNPRALAWRQSLLTNPAQVYASVLLMKSVPADKSGVLITVDVTTGNPGLTVSTAWGVGGAVAGEASETLVLLPDGSERLISEAKSPYRRRLADAGGIDWVPARDGAVLTASDKTAIRQLAEAVKQRYPDVVGPNGVPQPWDVEFGFVRGELTLFQIRPLVERGAQRADRLLGELMSARSAPRVRFSLDDVPMTRVAPP